MTEAVYGFIYASSIDTVNYREGQRIDLEPESVIWVHYDTATIAINEWPGQLWFVEVLEPLPSALIKEEADAIPVQSFKLVKQLANSFLFGAKGEKVCLLLNRVTQLDLREVEQLAALFSPIGAEAYAVAWNNWLIKTNSPTEHRDADHTGTLAIGQGENTSPIYNGFLLLNDLLYKKAKELEGDSAFIFSSSYGEPEVLLNPVWNKACSVLLQSAMALGAEQYVADKDISLLLAGWRLLMEH